MDSNIITALATGLLVIVGIAQIGILISQLGILKSQRRHGQLELIGEYRRRWDANRLNLGTVIYIGRDESEYYQVLAKKQVAELTCLTSTANLSEPTVWALDATRIVFGIMSDICTRLLQGQLDINLVYPFLGTELLRHSRPLRVLLDRKYTAGGFSSNQLHLQVRNEIQDWLIYHDGIRRRSLILIDLLWAEAARLEDLPPSDMRSAAEAKIFTGESLKKRLANECNRLNRKKFSWLAFRLSRYLRHSEYRRCGSRVGLDKRRLDELERDWTTRLLYNFEK